MKKEGNKRKGVKNSFRKQSCSFVLTNGPFFSVLHSLDDTNLVGNLDGLVIGGETDESLLLSVGTDEGVNLDGLDVVHLLNGILDLVLVGVDVDDEDEGVVGLNLGHGSLSGQGVVEDGELVQTSLRGDRSAGVGRLAGSDQSGRTAEAGGVEDTTLGGSEVTLDGGLLGRLSLSDLSLLRSNRSLSLGGHLELFL